MTPLIEVAGLRYCYDDGTEALRGVDFRLLPGETVALLGANGSGKTTFVLHLNGLLRGQGTVRVCGLDVEPPNLEAVRSRIGMVFQNSDEQLFLPTVLEDVAFGPLNQGKNREQAHAAARAALRAVSLEFAAARAPYHLSAGEQRRAALAGVLAMEPEILVLDEPTTFLDPPGRRQFLDLVAALPQAKLIVTHDTGLARRLATRAVFFERGVVAGDGPVDHILSRFGWDE
jgi:energy-coupling factor transporter ATP-binding protein EcfA2